MQPANEQRAGDDEQRQIPVPVPNAVCWERHTHTYTSVPSEIMCRKLRACRLQTKTSLDLKVKTWHIVSLLSTRETAAVEADRDISPVNLCPETTCPLPTFSLSSHLTSF